MESTKSEPTLSSSPLALYRSKYMRSNASIGRVRTSSRRLSSQSNQRGSKSRYDEEMPSSTRTEHSNTKRNTCRSQKIKPERRLQKSSSTSSLRSLNIRSSYSTKPGSSRSVASTSSGASRSLESLRLRQQKEHIEMTRRLDDMRRRLDQRRTLASFSDRTKSSKPTSSTIVSSKVRHEKHHHPNKAKIAGIRLSEFTSITVSLSDDENESVDDATVSQRQRDMASKKPSPEVHGEEDTFRITLSKMVDHVRAASSRNFHAKSVASNDLSDDTTEHRSNYCSTYSENRTSLHVRRASDFLFSSHHHGEEKEEEDHHQWEITDVVDNKESSNDWWEL